MKPVELRALVLQSLPDVAQAESASPSVGKVYLPPAHKKALSLDRPLVLGGRGAGKTFWLGCLRDPDKRRLVASEFGAEDLMNLDVATGFDPSISERECIDARVLEQLVNRNFEPADIWYAVIANCCLPRLRDSSLSWEAKVRSILDNAEDVVAELSAESRRRQTDGQRLLIAFDGLDRLSPRSWDRTVALLRGLLQATLEFSRFRGFAVKAFLRPDLFEDPGVRSFPDASKLVSLAVALDWSAVDLYGLFWQYLANGDGDSLSPKFRQWAAKLVGGDWSQATGIYVVPETLRRDESKQKALFHRFAGSHMGSGPKRGDTWKWLPSHLQDSKGYVSPRSFLVALYAAAERSASREQIGIDYALHWRAIQDGVGRASRKRVEELSENFPWMQETMAPLSGLGLPARRQDIVSRWRKAQTLEKIFAQVKDGTNSVPLPASVSASDAGSLIEALEHFGACRVLPDRRIDFPDIVRVDAGMTRRGGVPVKRRP
jgi:hypothetical protein